MIYKIASEYDKDIKEDLYQVGVIGLINAYKNYDPSYETKFSTYAYPYIMGEMKKFTRENKSIKISRDIQYLSKRLDRLIELLSQKYNRVPTTLELSEEVGIEEWKIIEALNIRGCVKSLDEPVNTNEKEISLVDLIPSNSSLVDYSSIDELMSYLTEEEQKLIKLRYFYDKSQEEVSILFGYSQAKISREEKKILNKLRSYYN